MDIGRAGFLPDLKVFIHVSQRMRFHWNVRSLCDHGALSS
jgi:hypothetical protein